jgi:hypothetical protein
MSGTPQLNDGIIQVMRELRANGWSLQGIARVYRRYGVTGESVKWLVGEREDSGREGWGRERC